MYVKHSKRTIRDGCKHCGRTDLYWGHDTNAGATGNWCAQCKSANWVLLERDTLDLHNCRGVANPFNLKPKEQSEVKIDGGTSITEAVQAEAPKVATTPPSGDAFAMFQQLMASMAPQVDLGQVSDLIKKEIDALVFPTRTVVEQAKGEVIEIENSHSKLADVTLDLLAGEHVLMVGPAGTGKSTIAEQAAESLGLEFYAISLSPMTPASQILGYMQAEGQYVRTLYREAYENGGVFHFDEFDNAHPSVLAVINASLANGQMAFPDAMVKRHADFRCVASANTYGRGPDRQYVGRQQIDAATLDRFAIETIEVDEALEATLCAATGVDTPTKTRVLDYVRRLRKNAADQAMTVVVSPRASIGMCKLIQAGKKWEDAVESRVRRGMSDKDWNKLTAERF